MESETSRDLDELVRRLGLRPIAGGSDAGEGDEGGDGPGEGSQGEAGNKGADGEAKPQPTAEELFAQEREARIRLEGEVAALRARPVADAKPAAKRPEDLTIAELDAAATEIENDASLTEAQRTRGLIRVEALKLDRQRREQETATRPLGNARKKLGEYIDKYPELNQRGSDLLGKVQHEVDQLADEFGWDPQDPRTQVVAVERVVGGHKLGGGMDVREFGRRRVPVGGAGGGAGGEGGGGGKPDPLKTIPKWQIEHWQRLGYSHDEMVAEAKYFRPHRRGAPA